jgi:hypothetical protein
MEAKGFNMEDFAIALLILAVVCAAVIIGACAMDRFDW